jgi:hypothetical protein
VVGTLLLRSVKVIRSGRVKFHDALGPFMVPIDSVCPHPENYNMGDEEAVEESVIVSGMYRPVIVQESTGYILAGNTTYATVQSLGSEIIPVVALAVDNDTAFRIMVGDNETARRAVRNRTALIDLLERLGETDHGLLGTGKNADDLARMRELEEMPLHFRVGHRVTFTVELPRELVTAYREVTREADTDEERFELLLRLAGWSG